MTNITWEHNQLKDMHAIKGHFIDHDSYVKVVVSPKGWEFYYGLGKKIPSLSNSFHEEIVKKLIFSLLSTVQQENPFLFQSMRDVSELTKLPYALLVDRVEQKYATEIGIGRIDITDESNVFFVMDGYVIDDIYVKKVVSQYYIDGNGEIKRRNRTSPLYSDEKEKEVLLNTLQMPESFIEKDFPYELIEKEKYFKMFLEHAKIFAHAIAYLKEPPAFTYTILSSTYNGETHSYEIQVNELPDFTFQLRFYKKRLNDSSLHLVKNKLFRYNFPLNHYRSFLQPIQEYLEKKSVYRIRFLM